MVAHIKLKTSNSRFFLLRDESWHARSIIFCGSSNDFWCCLIWFEQLTQCWLDFFLGHLTDAAELKSFWLDSKFSYRWRWYFIFPSHKSKYLIDGWAKVQHPCESFLLKNIFLSVSSEKCEYLSILLYKWTTITTFPIFFCICIRQSLN